jgi:hypothetical protein
MIILIMKNWTSGAKISLFIVGNLWLFLSVGCGNMLTRQVPSKDAYIAQYLAYFDETQIENIEYAYQGAIGGAFTVARVQFKSAVKTKNNLLDQPAKNVKIISEVFDPEKMLTDDIDILKRQLTLASDGNMPSWLDFPFNRKMRKIKESFEGSDGQPRYEKVWYIDDDHNVVYVNGNWG